MNIRSMMDSATRTGTPAEVLRTVQSVLAVVVVDVAGPPDDAFAPGRELLDYGLNSLQLLQIHGLLEDALGFAIDKAALFDCPTIGDLADHLAMTAT